MIRFRSVDCAALGMALALSACAGPNTTGPSSVESQIRQAENAVNAAYAANDLPTYFSFYADDLRALFAEGPTTLPAYKSDWTSFIKGGGAIEAFKDTDMQVQVSPGGDAAVASYLATVTTRDPAKGATAASVSETDVWFKRDGRWKIVEIHYSENPTPKN